MNENKLFLLFKKFRKKKLLNSDPLYRAFRQYEDIKNFISEEKDKTNSIKHLYRGNDIMHKILYVFNEIINITYEDKIQKNLAYNFYLNLLIKGCSEVIDYTYPFDYIMQLYKEQNNIIYEKYKLIILAKIIIDLIKYFKTTDEYDDVKHKEQLNEIENDNKKIIEENKDILNDINLKFDETKDLSEIYIEIIIGLIKKRKFEKFEDTIDIIEQLDLNDIDFTDEMLRELNEFLISDESIVNEYMIKNENDLNDEKKINFYYILIKYIIKTSLYIYHFPFLLNTRKNILVLLKSNKITFENINNNRKIIKKIKYILKFIVDSDYYVKKLDEIFNVNNSQLSETFYHYNDLFESKRNDINNIENMASNKINDNGQYLNNYDIIIIMKDRFPIKDYISFNVNCESKKTDEKFAEIIIKLQFLVKRIKDIIINYLRKIVQMLKNYLYQNKKDVSDKTCVKENNYDVNESKKDFYCSKLEKINNINIPDINEFNENDSGIISILINNSKFILKRNNDNELYYDKIYISSNGIEINSYLKKKILYYIDNYENIEKKEKFLEFYNLCIFANSLKKTKGKESIIDLNDYAFYNPKMDKKLYLKSLNCDNNNMIYMNESMNSTKNSSMSYDANNAIIYKKTVLKNITLMKKMIRNNKSNIYFLRNNNELFYYDNFNSIKQIGTFNLFTYNMNENRLKDIQEKIKDNNNKSNFKLNTVSKIQNKNKEDIIYYLFGGSENGFGKIKLYSYKNEKYEYIHDIKIKKKNDKNDIPLIKQIEIAEKTITKEDNMDDILSINPIETHENNNNKKVDQPLECIEINEQKNNMCNSNHIENMEINGKKYYLFVQYNNKEVDIFDIEFLK